MLYLSLDKHLNAVWGLKLLNYSKKCLEFYLKLLVAVFGERKVWLCSLSHKMFPYCNMVIVSSVSHCSYAIIQVSRPKMTWVLPNIAIKMQQRSCVLSIFWIISQFSAAPTFSGVTLSWAGSSSILLEVLVSTKIILWQRRECLWSWSSVPSAHRQLKKMLHAQLWFNRSTWLTHPLSI